jgi:hypothetical protein
VTENSEIVCRPQFVRRDFPGGDERFCFMIMPFHVPLLEEVYRNYVKPTIEATGIECIRGDDVFSTNSIIEDIWSSLCKATFVVGDFTGRNPNVLYEAGIAHTLGKSLIGLTQDIEDIPFDFRHRRVITYRNSPSGYLELQSKLRSTVVQLLQSREKEQTPRPVENQEAAIRELLGALREERERSAQMYLMIERRHLEQIGHFHEVLKPVASAVSEDAKPAFCHVDSVLVSVDGWDDESHARTSGDQESVADFEIGTYPVTNRQYYEFTRSTGHYPPEHWHGPAPARALADAPVVGVSWTDVTMYCAWLGELSGRDVRLPTEAEWLAAAGCARDRQLYPWGDDWRDAACNSSELNVRGVTSVHRFDSFVSPCGCVDMLGNVWEWTSSEYATGAGFPWRAVRGGANYTQLKGIGVLARLVAYPGHFLFVRDLGFRVVRDTA